MGRCCGGKNAGKPIPLTRYLAGVGVFTAYHSGIAALLHAAAIPFPDLAKVRDFHRDVFLTEMREVLARQDINVQGVLKPPPVNETCTPELRSTSAPSPTRPPHLRARG
jgi:hypothetical protein